MKMFYIFMVLVLSGQFLFAQEFYSLQRSINQAKISNFNLDIARENLKRSYLDIQKVKADKLPTLGLTFDYKKEYLRPVLNTFRNSLDLTWDLSIYKKHLDLSKSLLLKAVQKNKEIIKSSLVYQVKLGYFSLMRLKEELSVLEQNINLLKKQREITKAFVDSQIKLQSSLSQVEDQINRLENQILFKKIQIGQQRDELIHTIFVSHYKSIEFQKYKIKFSNLPKLSFLLNQISKCSPLIQSLKYEQKAIRTSIDKPWKDKLPIISAGIGQQEEWPNSWSKYDFHVGFTIPILDNSNAKYKRQVSIINYMKKKIEIKKKKKNILDNVAILYKKARLSKKLFLSYKKSYEHQEKTFSLVRDEYKAGLGNINDLINIQKDMINSAFNMHKTFYEYMIFVSQIDFYRGVDT